MRAAIYLRLSRDSETSTSIARQRETCMQLATRKGYDVVAVYDTDVDRSGYDRNVERPGLDRALADAAARRYDVLIVYRLDRLTRGGIVHLFTLLNEHLQPNGVALVSATEAKFDTTDVSGRLILAILAILAEYESETIGKRVRSARRQLEREGRWAGGGRPFGYQVVDAPDGQGRVLERDPRESALIREFAERVLAGESMNAVTRDYRTRGVRGIRGGVMTATTWRFIIRSPIVAGYIPRVLHDKDETRANGFRTDRDGTPLRYTDDPALDVETWRRVLALLDERKASGRRPRSSHGLLSGLVYCASCGARMSPCSYSNGSPRNYGCPTKASAPDRCRKRNAISAARLDEVVLAVAGEILPAWFDEAARLEAARRERQGLHDDEIARLTTALEQTIAEVAELRRKGASQVRIDAVNDSADAIDADLRALLEQQAKAAERADARELRQLLDGQALRDLPMDQQRRVCEILFGRIEIAYSEHSRGGRFNPARISIDGRSLAA